METEDHPLDYIDFEGNIPEGQYGAGTVMVWDRGTYRITDGNHHKGKLRIALTGPKLKGEWLLSRSRDPKKRWFLSKAQGDATLSAKRDDTSAASGRSMARSPAPMTRSGTATGLTLPGLVH